MTPKDKQEIVANLRRDGFDFTQRLVASAVMDVETYAKRKNLQPSEEQNPEAILQLVKGDKKFFAVLHNGRSVEIPQQAYQMDTMYNYLPTRYRTMLL